MEQKPLPSKEASLKFMAWDVKRMANALEAILSHLKTQPSHGATQYTHSEEAPF